MSEFNLAELRNEILAIVKREGPVLPAQISTKVSSNVLFTSAILSELVAQNQIKITKSKIGGSPLYYYKGQESKLSILYDRSLKDVHKKVYSLLKDSQILRDQDLEPWQRVAMREIKDFAMMLIIKYNGAEEVFWKWYLVSDHEVKPKIVEILKVVYPQPEEEEAEEKIEPPVEEHKEETPQEEPKVEEPKKEPKVEEPKAEPKVEEKKEEPKEEQSKEEVQKKLEKPKVDDNFMDLIRDYFNKNNIQIQDENLIRKNSDAEFIVKLHSDLGELKYYVKAKNKKKINDAELLMIYTQGEKQKLPVILLSTGELTKKAEKYIEDELKGLVFKRISS